MRVSLSDIARWNRRRRLRLRETVIAPGSHAAVMARRHTYFLDGERKVAQGIHLRWYTANGIAELNEALRSPEVALALRRLAKGLPVHARPRPPNELLRLTREELPRLPDLPPPGDRPGAVPPPHGARRQRTVPQGPPRARPRLPPGGPEAPPGALPHPLVRDEPERGEPADARALCPRDRRARSRSAAR